MYPEARIIRTFISTRIIEYLGVLDIKDVHGCWSRWQSGLCICSDRKYKTMPSPDARGLTIPQTI